MYGGVPTTAPSTSSSPSRVTALPRSAARPVVTRPKSVTRGRPSLPISTFSGLKSRWTRPAAWAAANPRPHASSTAITSRHGRRAASSHARRLTPSISSIAMNVRSPIRPIS